MMPRMAGKFITYKAATSPAQWLFPDPCPAKNKLTGCLLSSMSCCGRVVLKGVVISMLYCLIIMCVRKGAFSRHKAKLKRCQGEPRRTPDMLSPRTEPPLATGYAPP